MTPKVEIHQLSPSLSVWHRYEPAVKADLFSTKLGSVSGIYLVDPISLDPTALRVLLGGDSPVGIVVTNGNHARAVGEFSCRLGIPIYAHPEARGDLDGKQVMNLSDGCRIAPDLTAWTIEGAAPGEVALHYEAGGGTLVFGDALINMGSQGFAFLPSKYCADPKLMRRSLRKLLHFRFERMLFAHGLPMVSQARARLVELLGSGQ